jgi:acyl carrier protein
MEDLKIFIQSEILNIAFSKVDFDESLIESRLLDSITVIDLLVTIEEKIGKTIPQHLINSEHLDTINRIVATVENIK